MMDYIRRMEEDQLQMTKKNITPEFATDDYGNVIVPRIDYDRWESSKDLSTKRFGTKVVLLTVILFCSTAFSLLTFMGMAAISDSNADAGVLTTLPVQRCNVTNVKLICKDLCSVSRDISLLDDCMLSGISTFAFRLAARRIDLATRRGDDRMRRLAARFYAVASAQFSGHSESPSVTIPTLLIVNFSLIGFLFGISLIWLSALKIACVISGRIYEHLFVWHFDPEEPEIKPLGAPLEVPTYFFGFRSLLLIHLVLIIGLVIVLTPTTLHRMNNLQQRNGEFAQLYKTAKFGDFDSAFQIRSNPLMLFDTLYDIPLMRLLETCSGKMCNEPFYLWMESNRSDFI